MVILCAQSPWLVCSRLAKHPRPYRRATNPRKDQILILDHDRTPVFQVMIRLQSANDGLIFQHSGNQGLASLHIQGLKLLLCLSQAQ